MGILFFETMFLFVTGSFIKSGSSMDHHQSWIITISSSNLDHHWIIIKAGSSLDYHQSWIITGSSWKLDHDWIIIITASAISIKWCYLSILLVIGSSIEPTLFHVGCRPSLHVGIHHLQHLYLTKSKRPSQHLHLTMWGKHPPPCQTGTPNTYIWPWEEHLHHHVR